MRTQILQGQTPWPEQLRRVASAAKSKVTKWAPKEWNEAHEQLAQAADKVLEMEGKEVSVQPAEPAASAEPPAPADEK